MENGCIHIYQGNGKGKTTAALGVCLRACGAGLRVGWASFLKDGTSSELAVLSSMNNVTLFPFLSNVTFTFCMTPAQQEEATAFYEQLLDRITAEIGKFDLIVLDEVLDAVQAGLLSSDALQELIDASQEKTELIFTGRRADAALLKQAHYLTDMHAIRHPFEHGIAARKGIEY